MRKIRNTLGLGAVAAVSLSSLALGAGAAQAQSWGGWGARTVERCSGDRCATYRCDGDGDDCTRVSGWRYRPSGYYYNRGYYGGYYGGGYDYSRTTTRCDSDGDRCATFRCDSDGDRCTRVSGWWYR